MAQIISGVTPQEAGFAYLQGHDRGTQAAQRQQELEQQRQQIQFEQMMQIRQAALEQKREETRSQALLNERAQMGDAQGIQELALRAQSGQDPDQKMMESVFGTLHRITNPDARKLAIQSIGSVIEEHKKHQENEAATAAVERAGADGLIDPKTYQERLKSGEPPQNITQELVGLEKERTIKTMAAQKAAQAVEQASTLVQAAPKGPGKLRAEYLLTQYQNSPTDQAKPGSDADLIQKIQQTLLGTDAEYKRRQEQLRKDQIARFHRIPMGTKDTVEEGLPSGGFKGAMTGEAGAPDPYEQPPVLKTDVKRAKAEKEKRYVGSKRAASPEKKGKAGQKPTDVGRLAIDLSVKAKDDHDLARLLEENGVELTEENLNLVRKALGNEKNRARSNAGADR